MAWVLFTSMEMATERPSSQAAEFCDEFPTTAALLATARIRNVKQRHEVTNV